MEVYTHDLTNDIECFYLSACTQPDIPATFEKLEQLCGGFTGRQVFGISGCDNGDFYYYACATARFKAEFEVVDLPLYIIPQNRYLCTTLSNWPANVPAIPKLIDKLFEHPQALKGSVCVEDYYSDDDMRIFIGCV
ncbi:hypothetical protein LT679_13865 [Mucilaginibacter roseus]|uniref:AraC family transcriptional regulator n=1 Tax=Mucilaginibacter roseus TaxID=1528868 RepID=A0ABS8U3M0_9SPHI|nr:hypothetical protein [Mucilaginibacter roseus]MCD8741696.1 hypothetical protein [Mucilaginibacter roseus]